MRKDADDGFRDCWEGCGAEDAIAAVKKSDALFFEIHDEADHDTPIKKGPVQMRVSVMPPEIASSLRVSWTLILSLKTGRLRVFS